MLVPVSPVIGNSLRSIGNIPREHSAAITADSHVDSWREIIAPYVMCEILVIKSQGIEVGCQYIYVRVDTTVGL